MRRREFIMLVGSAAAATLPVVALAQQTRMPVIGFLAPNSNVDGKRFYAGFSLGMQQLGYLEGRDYVLERRHADSDLGRLPLLAEELIRLKPDVIVSGLTASALAAKQATASIPIVGINLVDPVGIGLVNRKHGREPM